MRAILTYHSVDDSGSVISVTEAVFDRHVRFLGSGRVRVLPLDELVAAATDEDAVAITFDDGYRSFASAAWPRLRAAGLPATLFVVTGRAGLDNHWGDPPGAVPDLDLLDWDELGVLAGEGVTLGSHSRSHPALPELTDAALADEIAGSADDLEARTGRRPTAFCYPYGQVDDRVAAAAAASYRFACTTELRVLGTSDRHERLPRLDTYYLRAPGRLEAWGTGRFRRSIRVRAALRRLRGRT